VLLIKQLDPLRSELSKITAENNKLHADFITLQTTGTAREKRAQLIVKQHQADYSELQFVNSQLLHALEAQKLRHEADRQRMEESLQRYGIVSVKQKAAKPQHIDKVFQKLQKIDIETGLEPQENIQKFPIPDPVACDIIKLSEQRAEMMHEELKTTHSQNENLETEISLLQDQVQKRDQEIKRLGVQLEISRAQQWGGSISHPSNPTITSSSLGIHDLPVAKRRIDQLEQQIELLQEHIEDLEKQVGGFQDEKKLIYDTCLEERQAVENELEQCTVKNNALVRNLGKLEEMVRDLEVMRAKSPTRGALKPKSAPENPNAPIAKNIRQVAELEEKHRLLQEKLKKTTARLAASKAEQEKLSLANANLQSTVEKLQSKRGEFNKTEKQSQPPASRNSPAQKQLRSKIALLEEDKWRLENKFTELSQQFDNLQFPNAQETNNELISLRQKLEISQNSKQKAESNSKKLSSDLEILERDRKALVIALERVETILIQVNGKIDSVTNERDNLTELYKQVSDQLSQLRKEKQSMDAGISTNRRVPSSSVQVQTAELPDSRRSPSPTDIAKQFQTLHAERDILAENIEALTSENKRLKQDFESCVYKQQETGSSAVEALRQLETERDGIRVAFEGRGREMTLLQDNYTSLQKYCERLKDEITSHEKKEDYLKSKVRKVEMDLDKEVFECRQLKSRVGEIEALKERVGAECERIRSDNEKLEDQVKQQRELIDRVDKERDVFQMQMDQKDVVISEMTEKIARMGEDRKDMERELYVSKEQLETLNRHLKELDQEMASLQCHLHSAVDERDRFASEAQRNGQEARNVGSDLVAVTNENQVLHSQITEIAGERDQLRDEIAECERYIQNLEDNIGVKEMERDNLMSSYRKLISDFEKMDGDRKGMGEEVNNLRMEVIMRDKRILQLTKGNEELSNEVGKFKIDIKAFERQCTNVTRSLATSERTISNLEKEKARMIRELTTAKEFAMKLDNSKDDVQKQLFSSNAEIDRLRVVIEKLEIEGENLGNGIRAEAVKVDKLEKLLVMERTKNINSDRGTSDDIDVARRHFDQREHALQTQHTTILASMTKQLQEKSEVVVGLTSRIQYLTKITEDQKKEVESFKRILEDVEKQVELVKGGLEQCNDESSPSKAGAEQKIHDIQMKIMQLSATVEKRSRQFLRASSAQEENVDFMMSVEELGKDDDHTNGDVVREEGETFENVVGRGQC